MQTKATPSKKPASPAKAKDQPARRPLSMHENVPTWCDCCCCEPEPRWQALEEQLEREQQQESPHNKA